jgi:mannose-1-phosphate guanylyltransferase
MPRSLWSIVLAAGAGRRLASVTNGVPKQFWRFNGGVSLLDITMQRMSGVAPLSRTVVIVDASHQQYLATSQTVADSLVLHQPMDRGTATGVLMALMAVIERDRDGIVVLTPSDHGVLDEAQFRQGVLHATQRALRGDDVILFGVEPTRAVDDYGWIVPAQRGSRLRPVDTFVEKPSPAVAEHLLSRGGIWNTMVVVSRASALRALFRARMPDLVDVFDAALALPPAARAGFLAEVYPHLPSRDFSRDVLEGAPSLQVYTWRHSLGWSDLGTPERLRRWLSPGAA